ncbi:MAG: helix-turn-helix domain-containing protein [Pseudonocardiaceae bacterium]
MRSIGRRIKEVRAWHDMTLKIVADRAGISEGYLSRIERGERPVNRRATLEGSLRPWRSHLGS